MIFGPSDFNAAFVLDSLSSEPSKLSEEQSVQALPEEPARPSEPSNPSRRCKLHDAPLEGAACPVCLGGRS